MKKNITLLSILALVAVAVTAFTTTTLAVEDATSNATIKAVAGGDTPVVPVDPTNPKDPNGQGPTDENDGTTTGQTGPMQINYLSNLNFGDNIAITSKTITANVKNDTPRFFQVSDLRGTAAGWKLNVSLGDFIPTGTTGTNKAITGASIAFKNGEAVTSNDAINGLDVDAATTHDVTLSAGSTDVQTILSADQGTGRGTWLARYTAESGANDNENIVFSAPTNSITANTDYQATLTWQLVDGVK